MRDPVLQQSKLKKRMFILRAVSAVAFGWTVFCIVHKGLSPSSFEGIVLIVATFRLLIGSWSPRLAMSNTYLGLMGFLAPGLPLIDSWHHHKSDSFHLVIFIVMAALLLASTLLGRATQKPNSA